MGFVRLDKSRVTMKSIMSEKIEQTSEPIAEVTTIANDSPVLKNVQLHVLQCLQLTTAPNLDDSHEIDVRCIYAQDGKVSFGIVFFETIDSFLVGANARLVMDLDKKIIVDPVCPMPVIRILKSSLMGITKALAKYKYHYFVYLRDKGRALLPDYLTGDVLKQVLDFTQGFDVEIEEEPEPLETTSTVKQTLERQGIHGVTDDAFMPYITSEKIH